MKILRVTTFSVVAVLGALLLIAGSVPQSDEPGVLLRAAIQKEEVEGDLRAAIEQYKQIIAKNGNNRSIAAKALFRLGGCYEKLGQEEARKTYQQLLSEYADQTEVAAQARERLAALSKPDIGRGITVRQVWAGPGADGAGGISPDGRYLTYTDWDTGDLAVRDLSTGKNRHITNKGSWEDSDEFAESSVFAPDSKRIVYEWFSEDPYPSYDLRIIGLDGSGDRLLLRGEEDPDKADYFQPLQWSSDGKRILAALYRDWPVGELALVTAANGLVQVVRSRSWRAGPGNSTAKASLSPDGRYVVYDQAATEGGNQSDIFMLSVDEGRESVLVQDPADERNPVWTPDGKHVIFASDRTGSVGFWSIEVADGKPKGVPKLVKADVGSWSRTIGFTRDGSLYYALNAGMEDVYIAELDPVTGKVVGRPKRASTGFVGSNMGPAWSPDGQYLTYDSLRGRDIFLPGSLVTVIRNMRTGEEREIRTKLIKGGPSHWFPDGHTLLYPAYRGPNLALHAVDYYRLDVRTGEANLIRQSGGGDSNYPTLSPDGKTIYFEHRKDGRSSLMAYEVDSRREGEVYSAGAHARVRAAAVSPDSKELAFVEGGTVARIIPASGGEPRELLRVKRPRFLSFSAGGTAWSPDGQYLYISECDDIPTPAAAHCELSRIPAKGGEPQRLGITMVGIKLVSVNPDGRRIAFGSGQTKRSSSEIWVMENFLSSLAASR